MDIEYLLLLQRFRNSINDALTPFMEAISLFAVTYLIIVPAFIYWCIDKKSGLYTIGSYNVSVAFNAVLKLTACIYRPWIRDSRVIPAGDAITTATGYSFPSGHTTTAVPIYGGLGVCARKVHKWITTLCVVCLVLTAFSRNYLGVHTPQDVAVGILIGTLTLFGMSKLFKYVSAHPEKENYFLLGGILFGIGSIIYITLKSYPMDYVDGKLLVDPQKMMKDGYGDVGMLIAFCTARFIEKTWVKFKPVLTKDSLAVGLVGAVITFFLVQMIGSPLQTLLGLHWGAFAKSFIIITFIVAVWPAVMKHSASKHAEIPENTEIPERIQITEKSEIVA